MKKKKIICLDTETTGFSTEFDRIVEIGCVDISNGWANRTNFQCYINPERSVPKNAVAVHGLDEEFLKGFKTFTDNAENFLQFIEGATLVIHNASFDIRFLNAELERCGRKKLENEVVDTLLEARRLFPGKQASLDALQKRFNINIPRNFHGALLDSEILAQVYIAIQNEQLSLEIKNVEIEQEEIKKKKLLFSVTKEELNLHESISHTLQKIP